MNKNRYRLIFSKRLGALVAVAEIVNAQGKSASGESQGGSPERSGLGVIASLTPLSLALLLAAPSLAWSQTLPTGGVVTAGQATIGTSGNTMTINQSTQKGVINWNTFDIGQSNTVQFNQPNAAASTLNRVTGGVPSNIQGQLLANGQVLIQNANGILFGNGAIVNVGSLLATTQNIDPTQYMNGNTLNLNSTGINAGIVNNGAINAQGYVVLAGDQVKNAGNITVPGGQVVLAAGDSATVAINNGQGVSVTLTNAAANALIDNSGNIQTGNGAVLLTARGANTLLDTVINLSGVVRAGTVVADAGNTGDVVMTGKIDASNASAGGVGGTVVLSGDRVGLFGNASINVTGDTRGGTVIIGGDSLSKVPGTAAAALLPNGVNFANLTVIDSGVTIQAGAVNGLGGFVETSGHVLQMTGVINVGQGGEWLIDPTDITITGAASSNLGNSGPSQFDGGSNATASVLNTAISGALNAGGSVTITTAGGGSSGGNITQNADIITNGGASGASLTMIANRSINIMGNIGSTGSALNLSLIADASNQGCGTVSTGSAGGAFRYVDLRGGALNISGNTMNSSGASAVVMYDDLLNIGGGCITGIGSGQLAIGRATVSLLGNTSVTGGTLVITGNNTDNQLPATGAIDIGGNISFTVGNNATVIMSGIAPFSTYQSTHLSLNSTYTVGAGGTLNITGVSSNMGNAVYVEVNNFIFQNASTGIFAGIVSGVNNTVNNVTGGYGVVLAGNITATNASLTVTGRSEDNNAVLIYPQNMSLSGGSLTINGNSGIATGAAVYVYGIFNLNISNNAAVNITGNTNVGTGIYFPTQFFLSGTSNNAVNIQSNGNIAIYGNVMAQGGPLSLTMIADTANAGTGAVSLGQTQGMIDLGGGSINISANTLNTYGISITVLGNVTNIGGGTITGAANTAWGQEAVLITGGSLNVTSGVLNVSGTSNADGVTGVRFQDENVTVGSGATLNVSGSSLANGVQMISSPGVAQPSMLNVADGGTVNFNGASLLQNLQSGTGVMLCSSVGGGGLLINVDRGGTLNITGNSYFSNTGVNIQAANLTLNGTVNVNGLVSSNGAGITIDNRSVLNMLGGDASFTGGSNSGTGINILGAINQTGGTLTMSGNSTASSTTGMGVVVAGSLNVTGGTMSLGGTSNGSGTGVLFASANQALNFSGNTTVSVIGRSATGNGVTFANTAGTLNINVSNTSQVGVIGISNAGGNGLEIANNVTVSGGTALLGGTSNTGLGVIQDVGSTFTVNGAGALQTVGISNIEIGLRINGNASITDNGSWTIGGVSNESYGVLESMSPMAMVMISGNGSVIAEGVSVNGTGNDFNGNNILSGNAQLNLTGVSTNGVGLEQSYNITASGGNTSVILNGTSDNGTGFQQDSSANLISDGGTVSVTGNSANGTGVALDGVTNTSGAALTEITGSSNGAGAGVEIGGSVTANGSGTVTNITGSSNSGVGIENDGTLSPINQGVINLNGASSTGNGTVNNGTINNDNGSLNVSGDLVNNGTINTSNGGSTDVNGSVDNNGSINNDNGSVNITGNVTNDPNGSLNTTGGNGTTNIGGDLNNSGNVSTTNNGTLNVGGNVTNNGTINTSNGSTNINGSVDNNGSINNDNGSLNVGGDVNIGDNGSLDTSGNGSTNIGGNLSDNGSVNTTDNGSLNVGGDASIGDNGSLDTSGNGSTNIGGNLSNNGSVNTTDNGSLNVGGDASIGDNGSLDTSGNGSTNIGGNLSDNGSVNTTDNGSLNVGGNASIGDNGSLDTSGNGSTNIGGNLSNNGSVNTTDNGSLNVGGNANIGDNGSLNTSGNGSTNIGGDLNNSGNVSTTDNGSLNVTGNVTGNGSICGNLNGDDSSADCAIKRPTPQGGAGSASGSSNDALGPLLVGGAGLAALVDWFLYDSSRDWILESPQALTVDAGDKAWWADGALDYTQIDAQEQRAIIQLHARAGMVKRQLNFRDRTGSVDHFQTDDAATNLHSTLSFNRDTREYFFEERGVTNGRPYSVKAHGWLKARVGVAGVRG